MCPLFLLRGDSIFNEIFTDPAGNGMNVKNSYCFLDKLSPYAHSQPQFFLLTNSSDIQEMLNCSNMPCHLEACWKHDTNLTILLCEWIPVTNTTHYHAITLKSEIDPPPLGLIKYDFGITVAIITPIPVAVAKATTAAVTLDRVESCSANALQA